MLSGDSFSPLELAVHHRLGITEAFALETAGEARHTAASFELGGVDYWSALDDGVAAGLTPTISAVSFSTASLSTDAMAAMLAGAEIDAMVNGASLDALPVLALPTPDGGLARFGIDGYDLLGGAAAEAFPDIHGVRLYGLDDPTAFGTAVLTSSGLTSYVSGQSGDWAVRPIDRFSDEPAYASFYNNHQVAVANDGDDHDHDHDSECGHIQFAPTGKGIKAATEPQSQHTRGGPDRNPDRNPSFVRGGQLRTHRTVVATTGELTASIGGQSATYNEVVSIINEANATYLRDLSVKLQLVSDTRAIYTNAATDGYTNGDVSAMSGENESIMNSLYGFATFDVGQVLGTGSGNGIAFAYDFGSNTYGSVGSDIKAKAATAGSISSPMFRQVIKHEFGHQHGASHTFDDADDDGRSPLNAYEPGPGSTLMSYGALGYPGDFVPVTDPYFHNNSIDQIDRYLSMISFGATAGSNQNTNNYVPRVYAGPDRTIPTGTPFELTGAAWDDNGAINYTWEQLDRGTNQSIALPDDGSGPLFR